MASSYDFDFSNYMNQPSNWEWDALTTPSRKEVSKEIKRLEERIKVLEEKLSCKVVYEHDPDRYLEI